MKKLFTILVLLLVLTGTFNVNPSYSQTNNVVLELGTGTWCQWCPCGHQIADAILQAYPNMLILEYHGPLNYGGDPFTTFNGYSIINTFGISSWPSGVIGRRSGVIQRTAWFSQASYQATFIPDITINIVKSFNATSRELTVTANVTSTRQIDSTVNINYVLMENNLVYPQTGNSSCTGGSTYIHNHVVRNMVSGALGESFSTGSWAANTLKTKTWVYTVPAAWVADNLEIGVFCHFPYGNLSVDSYILNSGKAPVMNPTGIGNENGIVKSYSLEQNYPNPFNPVTNIKFSVPKNGRATLKIYDVLGNEVETSLDEYINAGTYNVTVDGSKLSSGVYYYRLSAGDFRETKKMMLIK